MNEEAEGIEELLKQLEGFQHVFLATMDGNQPRVRPVTLINHDGKLWVTTDTWSEKVKQIEENPKVEISFVFQEQDRDCCLRATGQARIIKDKQLKTRLANHCDFFDKHWENVEDPDYTLLEISPSEATIVTPDKTTHLGL